jgi:uncharacterized protein YcfJ
MNPTQSPKALWATIGVLAVAVAALGGVLVHQQGRDPTPQAGAVSSAQPVRAPEDPKVQPVRAPEDLKPVGLAATDPPAPPVVANAARAVPPPTAALPPPVRAPAPASSQLAQTEPAPMPAPAPAPVCAVCGRVESVRTVHHPAPPTGVGAVAGGVVGGVVGNQIGHGSGRAAATVLGAVGGGYLGHTIEKRTRTVTAYEVRVRMADGSLRTVETATAPPIGKAVTLEGKVLRPADGKLRTAQRH